MISKPSIAIIFLFFLSSCWQGDGFFSKEYHERITGIKFPAHYSVLESFDNGEWLTGVVIHMDSMNMVKFIRLNKFDTLGKSSNPRFFFRESQFERYKPDYSSKNVYFIRGSNDKNNWAYVVNLNRQLLWGEISYPDYGGR